MMKRILLVTLLSVFHIGLQAQTLREVFQAMPDSLQALLTKNNRMDMLDFIESNMESRVTNRLEEQTTLDTLTADYLHLTLTDVSSVEMKLVKKEKDTVLVVVHTAAAPVKDSVVKCYTADWKEKASQISRPAFSAYETKSRASLTEEQLQLLNGLADMELVEIRLSPQDNTLRYHLSLEILNKEDREKVKELVKDVVKEI